MLLEPFGGEAASRALSARLELVGGKSQYICPSGRRRRRPAWLGRECRCVRLADVLLGRRREATGEAVQPGGVEALIGLLCAFPAAVDEQGVGLGARVGLLLCCRHVRVLGVCLDWSGNSIVSLTSAPSALRVVSPIRSSTRIALPLLAST